MKYTIVFDTDPDVLVIEVQKRLNDGWELCGQPYCAAVETHHTGYIDLMHYQALIKRPITIGQ